MKRKQPKIAEKWQLAVLKKLHSESATPTEGQRAAAVAETGLDEKWVRNWFTRQRLKSRAAPPNRRNSVVPSNSEPHPAHLSPKILPTFRLQVDDQPQRPPCTVPASRSASASVPSDPDPPIDPPSRTSVRHHSPRLSRSLSNPQDGCQRRASGRSTRPNDPSPNKTTLPRTSLITTYFRDPLANRYPDFSQFFHPLVYQRFRDSGSEAPINGPNLLMQLLANADMDPHPSTHLKGLLNTPHISTTQVDQSSSSTCLRPWPIAFCVRLGDLMEQL